VKIILFAIVVTLINIDNVSISIKRRVTLIKTKSFPIISAKDQSSRILFVYENSFKEMAISFYNKCQPKIQM
jgi:hypothetical protein